MTGDRVFLVTGATGAVGSAIVPLLLAEHNTTVHVLLRAPTDDALRSRLQALVAFWGNDVGGQAVAERLCAVRGDVAQPRLGLSDAHFSALAATVTHVVHSAGNVKLNQPIAAARATTVSAVQELVRFADACSKAGSAPKIEYLSTVGVAGRRPGVVAEEPLGDVSGYHNTYERSKAEAEQLVLREAAAGLRATIHRPSMVVGSSRDGRIVHFQVFYHLIRFLAGSRTLGLLPTFGDIRLDLVPADYVGQVVVASSRRDDAVGRIFHLCSGPSHAMALIELGETLRQFLRSKGEKVYVPRYLPRAVMRMMIRTVASVAPARTRRALAGLPYFLDYLDEAQVFANERTDAFFGRDGLKSPPLSRFLQPVLDYWHARQSPEPW